MTELILEEDELEPNSKELVVVNNDDAPWGYKADGTPRRKPGRPSGSSNNVARSQGTNRIGNLEAELRDAIGGDIAATIGTVAPLVAWVLDERAERTARALARIAKRSPRFRKGLEQALSYRDYVALASLPPAIAAAVLIETGIIKPDSRMSKRVSRSQEYPEGLWSAYLELYGDQGSERETEFINPGSITGFQ